MPDPITHVSLSYLVARRCFSDRKGWFVLAGLAPDIDVAIGGAYVLITRPLPRSVVEFARDSLIFHPGLSAAIWFLPIYSVLLAGLFSRLSSQKDDGSFMAMLKLVFAGMLLHIGLDLLQPGNRPLWPLEITAGVDILPYSPAGRLLTITAALVLVGVDRVREARRRRSS